MEYRVESLLKEVDQEQKERQEIEKLWEEVTQIRIYLDEYSHIKGYPYIEEYKNELRNKQCILHARSADFKRKYGEDI